MEQLIAPTKKLITDPYQRIQLIDSVRGFALLGILLSNILEFGMPGGTNTVHDLSIHNEYSGYNYYLWWIVGLFFDGSMRGLFMMLFGASMVLITSKFSNSKTSLGAADLYYRRLIWLLLFSIFDAFIILWQGDILYTVSICGLFLFPFRDMKPKYIFLIAGLLLLFYTVKNTYQSNGHLRLKERAVTEQKDAVQNWKEFQDSQNLTNKRLVLDKEVEKMKGNYLTAFSYMVGVNVMTQTTLFYQYLFLDALIFMLIGIAFYKLKIFGGERSKRFYGIMAIVGYGIAIPMAYWKLNIEVTTQFDKIKILEQAPWGYFPDIRRLALTFGHLGLLILVYKIGLFRFIFDTWAKVGQMTLSNYLLQNIICSVIFFGYGFNYFNELERYQLYFVLVGIWVFNIAFSYLWLHFFKMGPFEWIWRSLTYWEWLPIRKIPKMSNLTVHS